MNNYSKILYSINSYQTKQLKYNILKGLIISTVLISTIFLFFTIINYFFYLQTLTKTLLFWSFIFVSIIIISDFILIHVLKMLSIIPTPNLKNIAHIISNQLPQIQDKLINTIELSEKNQNNLLVLASIEQKSKELQKFNFAEIISYKNLRKYARYILFIFFLIILLLILNSSIITEGTKRFTNYSTYYQPQLPFNFVLLNKSLIVKTGDDFEIKLKLEGKQIPSHVFIVIGNNKIPMLLTDSNIYSFTLKSITSNISFYFTANKYNSQFYHITAQNSPTLHKIIFDVEPPKYTNIKSFSINSITDLVVPYKSNIKVNIKSLYTDTLFIFIDSNKHIVTRSSENTFLFNFVPFKNHSLKIIAKNKNFETILFNRNINLIPDIYPSIFINSISDTLYKSKVYFHGLVTDDYGFSSLYFVYDILSNQKTIKTEKIPIELNLYNINQQFYFSFDFNTLNLPSNYIVDYYFSISDNDPFYPFKTTNSPKYTFIVPTLAQIDSLFRQNNSNIEQQFNNYDLKSYDLQLDINKFNQKYFNDKTTEWENKQFLNNLINKQQQLHNIVDSIKLSTQKNIEELKQINKDNEELLKKYEEIKKLLENILNDDIKKMLDSLNKLNTKFDNNKFEQMLKNYNQYAKKINNDINRTKELLQKLKIEQSIQNINEQLKELSKQTQTLSENIKKSTKISDKQKDSIVNNEFKFKQLMQQYEHLLQENQQLSRPFKLDSLKKEQSEIEKDFQEAKKQMNNDKNKQTSKELDDASQKMQKMSDKLSQMMQQNNEEQNSEDEATIIQLLNNLLNFSFEQEKVLKLTNETYSFISPKYQQIIVNQMILKNNFNTISDSIYALASRNPMINKQITDEVNNIKNNFNIAIDLLKKFNKSQAQIYQQKIIQSTNKLALLLQENLQNTQQSMSGMGKSSKKKQKTPSISDIQQFQQQLQQQLQQMLNEQQKGQKLDAKQLGEQIGNREQLQKMLQDYMNSENLSPDEQSLMKDIMNLNEQIKKDLINNTLTMQTLQRDKRITTRLLESETAENQRKQSNERQSNTAKQLPHNVPDSIINMYFNKNKQKDLLNLNNILLINFYNNYYYEYINRITN